LRPNFDFEPEGTGDGFRSLAGTPQIARIHSSDRISGAFLTEESQFPPPRSRQGDIQSALKAPIALRGCMPDQD